MNLEALPQTVVDALALETLTTAKRIQQPLKEFGPSRAAQFNALALAFTDLALQAGLSPAGAFEDACRFLLSDRVEISEGVRYAADRYVEEGTNPPNAADVMAEETL